MNQARKLCLGIAVVTAITVIIGLIIDEPQLWRASSVATAVLIAIGIGALPVFAVYQYTTWIIVALVAGLVYPGAFLTWGEFDLRNKWVILIVVQLVMFGMGTQMKLKDFAGVALAGKGVVIGLVCQFTIMPLVGFTLTRIFAFESEIAAGVILIGSCSSGLASNVMVYLARANLPLSVTLTAIATLLAPLLTPLWMKLLASTYIRISFLEMCIQIIQIVIVPIGAAMLFDALKNFSRRGRQRVMIVLALSAAWLFILVFFNAPGSQASPVIRQLTELFSFICGAVVVGVTYYYIYRKFPKINSVMPYVSMFGIVYFTLVTTAASRDHILHIGLFLLFASILHNGLGYFFGYFISKAVRMDEDSARTIALEVGLQNGGMASGIAGVMGKLATLGLAAAIFSPWMNISGSLLANYWRKRSKKKIRK